MRWLLLFLVVPGALVPGAGAAQIVAVVPDLSGPGPGDEGFAVVGDVAGWSVTDGEGTWRLPVGGDAPVWFVGDEDAWAARDGPAPSGTFGSALRLANDGDDLRLLDPSGREVDAFRWGDKDDGALDYTSPNLLWTRAGWPDGPWQDTDTARDWIGPRPHRMGESDWPATPLRVDAVTTYVSPDSSHDVLAGLLGDAQRRVHLHVYELRSQDLADRLAAAAQRGVDVQVLVEDRPVGQDTWERHQTADALRRIEAAGGTAWLAQNDRYRHHHLKVLVVDDAVAIQSENWVASGVPVDERWGNRGWGIVLHGAAAADHVAQILAADRDAWDTLRFDLGSYAPAFEEPPRLTVPTGDHVPAFAARRFEGPFEVRLVVTPEHTASPHDDPVVAAIDAARHRVWLQQLDLSTGWTGPLGWSEKDALLGAAGEAAARGLDVRAQAAAPFSSRDTGNAEALAYLSADGAATCTFQRPDVLLHNKGVIADETVYVGSMNGNHHSRSMNRELGVLIDDAEVAAYYDRVFEADTRSCSQDVVVPASWPTLFALALVAACRRCCPSPPGSQSPSSPRR